VKITLDRDRCAGHALRVAAAPDVYDFDDGGYCVLPSEIVPPAMAAQAKAGAVACPERALRVDED
jgi:ferredoxin